ncbi:hypothetical protein PMEGAPL125_53530 [Priestia megaterium]
MALDLRERVKYADMSPNRATNTVIATIDRGNVSERDTQKTVTYHATQQ